MNFAGRGVWYACWQQEIIETGCPLSEGRDHKQVNFSITCTTPSDTNSQHGLQTPHTLIAKRKGQTGSNSRTRLLTMTVHTLSPKFLSTFLLIGGFVLLEGRSGGPEL